MHPAGADPLYLGVDLGTSGCRALAIDGRGAVRAEARSPAVEEGPQQDPALWWQGLLATLDALFGQLPAQAPVAALSLDGTSGSVLLADPAGVPLTPALMYHDQRATAEADRIAAVAPAASPARGTGSGLARVLWLRATIDTADYRIHTQADWLLQRLGASANTCDSNNALKLGYDPQAGSWPAWLGELGIGAAQLPQVVAAGTPIGRLSAELCARWGLAEAPLLVAGTTDSTAAFIATGASRPGDAVTSLGSTLVLKVLAERPVSAPEVGVYSQPLGRLWLVGGASNSGGAVLRRFFDNVALAELSAQIDPSSPSGLDYYPLNRPGERFPHHDPNWPPRLEPRPADDVHFLHGLLEGIAHIEMEGYRLLERLGAPYPQRLFSAGGGAGNPQWTALRQRLLGIELTKAAHSEAAYGSACLAREGAGAVTIQ